MFPYSGLSGCRRRSKMFVSTKQDEPGIRRARHRSFRERRSLLRKELFPILVTTATNPFRLRNKTILLWFASGRVWQLRGNFLEYKLSHQIIRTVAGYVEQAVAHGQTKSTFPAGMVRVGNGAGGETG